MKPTSNSFAVAPGSLVISAVAMLAVACVTVSTAPAEPATAPDSSLSLVSAPPVSAPEKGFGRALPSRKLHVPNSIDSTGSRDVSAELKAFIEGAPNGSTIVFKAGGTYRLGKVIWMSGQKRITIEGNGATIKLTGPGNGDGRAFTIDGSSEFITIRDLTIVGNHAAAGTKDACCGHEAQSGIAIYGSFDVLIERVDIRRVGGDCVYVDAGGPGHVLSERITFRDSTCRLTGRMGAGVQGVRGLRIVNNVFDEIGYAVVGIEPDEHDDLVSDLVMRGNTIGSYGLTGSYQSALAYACDAPWGGGAPVRDVTITGNTVAGNRAGYDGRMYGLDVIICGGDHHGPRENIKVTNNTAKQPVDGPVMRIMETNGVTVTGNTQPLASGQLASFPGSTNVTYEGNNQ